MPFDNPIILILIALFVLLVLVTVYNGIVMVPQGSNYTLERFGRFARTLRPGLNLTIPFVERIGQRLNMMEQVLDVERQGVITRDNAQVAVDGVAFFQIFDPYKAAYEVTDLTRAILNLTMTNIRSVMGSMDLDSLLSNRDKINENLLRVVDLAAEPWGVRITRIEIKDIAPPDDLIESMARQMKAERDKRAEILRAEGNKQAQILEAEGRREAAFRDSEAREREAEAEARATQLVSDSIAQGDTNAINYFVAQNYVKALETIGSARNQKVLFLPMDTAGFLSSIAGITEIARDALDSREAQGAQKRSTTGMPVTGSDR